MFFFDHYKVSIIASFYLKYNIIAMDIIMTSQLIVPGVMIKLYTNVCDY